MAFTIEAEAGKREDFAEYRYRILRDGKLVAKYWVDFRGDDHGIEFVDGRSQGWPVGNVLDFIQGGGSTPVTLTRGAIAYLAENTPPGESAPDNEPAAEIARGLDAAIATSSTRPGRNRRLIVAAAALCWLACLFLPPLQIQDRDSTGWGLNYLLTGWLGPLAGHFEWFANPMALVAAIALWRGHFRTAFTCALIACLLVMLLPIRGDILADEGGHRQAIVAFRFGYWLWFAAPALLVLGAMPGLRPGKP